MSGIRQIAVAAVVVVSLLAPAMACALPDVRMTPNERACCRQMKGHCGSANMPASHNCCQKGTQIGHSDAARVQQVSSYPVPMLVAALPPAALAGQPVETHGLSSFVQHSPPASPPRIASVLKI